ncbi:MAG: hypothetical protein HY938_01385 [Nitrosomonadales bacterium]|nr:hypothetical protein [Nitrosomonadales bacterium]
MQIFIHIGWHKTGTTSIQEFLLKNRERLAITNKIYYPEEGMLFCAHHNLAWAIQNKKKSPWGDVPLVEGGAESFIIQAIDKARGKGCDTIIFSSEEFCTLTTPQINQLHDMVSRHADSVKIVAYIRRQDLIIESGYNMEVKWWGVRLTQTFSDYIKAREGYPNYHATLSNWANAFGSNSLIVRPFERELFDQKDVRVDFCRQVGLEIDNLDLIDEGSNVSLGPQTVEFLRILNNLDISAEDHEAISSRLLMYDVEQGSPSCIFFDPRQRVRFMEFCDEANSNLIKWGIELDNFKLDPDQLPSKNVNTLTLEEFSQLLTVVQNR